MSQSYSFVVGADIIRQLDECLCLYIYFDVIKVVCSNLHAMRANRVRCTRTGERGSPLHYLDNCIPFLQFIFSINFLQLLAGG